MGRPSKWKPEFVHEARKLCEAMDERVEIDESGGACVNWEVTYVGKATT